MNCEFSKSEILGFEDRERIASYVKENIIPVLSDLYQDFIPTIEKRIETIVSEWLSNIKDRANSGHFTWVVNCNAEAEIITQIMSRKYDLKFKTQEIYRQCEKNSLHKEIFLNAEKRIVTFGWSEKNGHLYGGKRFCLNEELCNRGLFADANQGVGTDLTLVSTEGDKVVAHSIVLTSRNEYFRKMIKGSFKESNSGVCDVQCSTSNLKNLIQFLYVGTIDPASHKQLEQLLELLEISHVIDHDLFNHCCDLISILLNDSLNADIIIEIIAKSLVYNIDEFLKPCLIAAETLEKNNSDAKEGSDKCVDWSQIEPKMLTSLLVIASKNQLDHVEKKLQETINQKLALIGEKEKN